MHLNPQLREDLKRLTRLVSTIADTYTAALFLPTLQTAQHFSRLQNSSDRSTIRDNGGPAGWDGSNTISPGTIELRHVVSSGGTQNTSIPSFKSLDLVVAHSHSPLLVKECRIQVGHGLLGWVAESGRSIHIAPFEMDSSTLGLYTDAEALRSLVAVPISVCYESHEQRHHHGVLVCDSKKSFSFTKSQLKSIEDIGLEVSRLLYWALGKHEESLVDSSWEEFISRTNQLGEAIGFSSIEILRISLEGFYTLEYSAGVTTAIQQSEQFLRLIHQTLPPHFPVVRIPNGDILIAVDNMMSAFFQNKVRTLANHLNNEEKPFSISIQTCPSRASRQQVFSVDAILRESAAVMINDSTKVVGGVRA